MKYPITAGVTINDHAKSFFTECIFTKDFRVASRSIIKSSIFPNKRNYAQSAKINHIRLGKESVQVLLCTPLPIGVERQKRIQLGDVSH